MLRFATSDASNSLLVSLFNFLTKCFVEEVWDRSVDGNIDEERWIVRCGCCCETTATPPANVVMKCEACNEWDPISEIEDRLKDPNHGLPPGLVDTYKTLLTLNKYAQSIYGWF